MGIDIDTVLLSYSKIYKVDRSGAVAERSYPMSKVREIQDGKCCKRASEGRHTETIITED